MDDGVDVFTYIWRKNKKEVKRMSLFHWRKSESSSGAFVPKIIMARRRYIDWALALAASQATPMGRRGQRL